MSGRRATQSVCADRATSRPIPPELPARRCRAAVTSCETHSRERSSLQYRQKYSCDSGARISFSPRTRYSTRSDCSSDAILGGGRPPPHCRRRHTSPRRPAHVTPGGMGWWRQRVMAAGGMGAPGGAGKGRAGAASAPSAPCGGQEEEPWPGSARSGVPARRSVPVPARTVTPALLRAGRGRGARAASPAASHPPQLL